MVSENIFVHKKFCSKMFLETIKFLVWIFWAVKKFGSGKKCWVRKICLKKIMGQKKFDLKKKQFWVRKIILAQKKFWVQKNFKSQFFLGPIKFLVSKLWALIKFQVWKKMLGSKNLIEKNCGSKKILIWKKRSKKSWVQNNFWSEKLFSLKKINFKSKFFFGPIKFQLWALIKFPVWKKFCPKTFWSTKIITSHKLGPKSFVKIYQ